MCLDDSIRILHFAHIPELGRVYQQVRSDNETDFKEKRHFELLIAKALSTCDYTRLKHYLTMLVTDMNEGDISFRNRLIVYHTISLITLLTRIAIIEGANEKDAYSLSDTYLSLDLQNLEVKPIPFCYEIIENFVKLIENAKFFKYESLLVNQVVNYIHNNITEKFTIISLSKHFQVTPEYLCSHFKAVTGMTIKTFINKEKINRTKFLLVSTDMTLLEITLELGFSDQSYFSKLFKKYTNELPLVYRKKGSILFNRNLP